MERGARGETLTVSERQATLVRLALVVFAGVSFTLTTPPAGSIPGLAYLTLLLAGSYSLYLLVVEPYADDPVPRTVLMSFADGLLVMAWLVGTGGFESPYYPIMYLSLTVFAFRYSTRWTVAGTSAYGLAYAGILARQGALTAEPLTALTRLGFLVLFAGFGSLFSDALLDQTVEKRAYRSVARDAQRTAEEKDHALSLHRATLEATADGVLVTDLEGRVQTVNDRFRQLFDLPAEQLGVPDAQLAREHMARKLEDPEGFLSRVQALYEEPERSSLDVLRFDDGRIVERYSRPQRIGDRVIGRVWSFRDVTETRRSRAMLKEYARRLEQRNEDLNQFAYVASHDLQEPLRLIKSFLDLLERRYGTELADEAHEFIEIASDSADRMRALIQDLLAFSRLETQAQPMEPVDADEVVADALKNLSVSIEETGAEIDVGELPTVTADPSQLVLLFQNLLSNAIKYSGDAPARVRIRAETDDDVTRFTVADEGIGIPEDEQDEIFDVFHRLSRDHLIDGNGMGLAIVQRIVERHGGEITVDSREGEGATFAFTIPHTSEEQDPATRQELHEMHQALLEDGPEPTGPPARAAAG